MTQSLLAGGFAILLWWLGTGLILYLDGLPRRTWRTSITLAGVGAVAALWGLSASAGHATTAGAYAAFACAIVLWGWLEMSFLMGFVTGPDRMRCPPGASGWRRFVLAARALVYHELALAAALGLIAALTWGADNRIGLWTFATLWAMRLSTKLNIFLGVRNLYENWLPDELRHLESFFRRRALNPLFPLSVTASSLAAILLIQALMSPGATAHEVAGYSLLAALVLLAILEHWMLVLPLRVDTLWRWSLGPRARGGEARIPPAAPAPVADAPERGDGDPGAPRIMRVVAPASESR